jgi:hypothetical protein
VNPDFELGNRVCFVVGPDVEGMVTGVQTTVMNKLYRVGWLHNGEYKDAWVYGFEIEASTKGASK